MDKAKRDNLLIKLANFYQKNVAENLELYNEARHLANIKFVSFMLFLTALACFILTFMFGLFFSQFLQSSENVYLKFNNFSFIIFFIFALSNINMYICGNYADIKGKSNAFFNKYNKGLPVSADDIIKEYLMPKFIKIFGNLSWCQAEPDKFKSCLNEPDYIKTLKIFDYNDFGIDDCFYGKYSGVKLSIMEARTSVWLTFIIVVVFLFAGVALPLFALLGFIIAKIVKLLFGILIFLGIIYCISQSLFNKSFRGVFVEIDMNKNFEGHTFVLEKDDYRNKAAAKMQGYELVKLEDPEFEKRYAVYSQSQIEARYILTTSFMERIKAIKDIYKAKYVRVAFKGKKIIITIHTGRDMFKMAGMKNMTKETFLQLFNEVVSVLDLVEILKLNQTNPSSL